MRVDAAPVAESTGSRGDGTGSAGYGEPGSRSGAGRDFTGKQVVAGAGSGGAGTGAAGNAAGRGGSAAGAGQAASSSRGPQCGNAVVEPGEECDGNCPTSCSTSNRCLTQKLVGSANSCDAKCQMIEIVTCVANDGCCATGCNANTDSDCSATCGNGLIEHGEVCDPPSSCPTACDDKDPCTKDTQTGSKDTCDLVCNHTAITAAVSGDGCCLRGGLARNDSDCAAQCNVASDCRDVVESDECHVATCVAQSCQTRVVPSLAIETCDGKDNDCDSRTDETASCPGGECVSGRCRSLCGNSRLDDGEECDPTVAGWQAACDSNCKRTIYNACSPPLVEPCATSVGVGDCIGNVDSSGGWCLPSCNANRDACPTNVGNYYVTCELVGTRGYLCVIPCQSGSNNGCPSGMTCNGGVCGGL